MSMAKSRWHGALRSAHKSCTHDHVFWKRGGVKRGLVADPWTSSRQFSHVLWLKVHSHLLLRACLLGSKGSYLLKLVRSDLDFLLWSAIQGACSSLAPCTSVVRVPFQALEPTAFLVHPVLAAIAEDAVAAHSSATDGARILAWTLQEVQSRTADHDLCLSCIYFQSFLLYCFFPSQEPPDTFLKRFSYDNKVIGIEVLPGDPRAELLWRLQAQWWRAAGWVLILGEHQPSLQILHCTPHQHGYGSAHLHTSPAPVAQSTPPHQVFSAPTRWPSEVLDQTPSPGLQKCP